MNTLVKICGITNLRDALFAAECGADFLGFVFYKKSPRYIEYEATRDIIKEVRLACGPLRNPPKMIAVCVDPSAAEIEHIQEQIGIDGIQFCGNEPPGLLASTRAMRIRTFTLQTLDRIKTYSAEAYLCDAHDPARIGGTGQGYDYSQLADIARKVHLIIAGGLTPANVGDVVSRLHPWGVDVSSGVEASPGIKDHAKIQSFIGAVRNSL